MTTAHSRFLIRTLFVLTALVMLVRLIGVSEKFFWVDEVASAIRVAGMTSKELSAKIQLNYGKEISAEELKRLVWQSPQSSLEGLIHSLQTEDAQHPPLIPFLQFSWAKIVNADPVSGRYLSSVFGILSILLLFVLTRELTNSSSTATVTSFAFALSPLQLIYSQQLREYSAWTALVILSTYLLIRAARKNRRCDWVYYAISITLGMYAYVVTAAVIVAHGLALLLSSETRASRKPFAFSVVFCGICFSPWILAILKTLGTVRKSNDFTAIPVSISEYVYMFILNVSRNFFDVGVWSVWDGSQAGILTSVISAAVAGLGILGIVGIYRIDTKFERRLLILITAICFLIWFLPDLILGGRRSLVPRYLMPCWITLYVGLGYFIHSKLIANRPRALTGIAILVALLSLGGVSFSVYLSSSSWWTTRPPELALEVRNFDFTTSDLVVADVDAGWQLISFANALPPKSKILLLKNGELPSEMNLSRYVFFKMGSITVDKFESREIGSGKFLRLLQKTN